MNSYLYIRSKGISSTKIITKLRNINVSVFEFYEKDNWFYIKIFSKDYKKIKKYLKTIEFQKVRYTGLDYLKKTLSKYRILFIPLFLAIIFIFISSNIIVEIEVIHENEKIVKKISEELENYGIKKFKFRKKYDQLQKIKDNIKNKHLDLIDWLEINRVGMKYVVRVEERIITKSSEKKEYCNLYATKDALVTNIKVYKGETVININDYVKKGDLLVRGDIKLNEETVNMVCANGEIQGEVWYEINIKVPFEYYDKEKTGKSRNNFILDYNDIDYPYNKVEYYF